MQSARPPFDREYQLPCAEAVLAGTLALMTGYAQARDEQVRAPMAHKILANLSLLAEHAGLSTQFRAMLRNLQAHWQNLQADPAIAPRHRDACAWQVVPPRVH